MTIERNQYSVPCHLANNKATIHLYADRIERESLAPYATERSAVPTHSLETVLLAVKQLLNSGVTSIEQVRTCSLDSMIYLFQSRWKPA